MSQLVLFGGILLLGQNSNSGNTHSSQSAADPRIQEAQLLLDHGSYQEAEKMCLEVLEKPGKRERPLYYKINFILAKCFLSQGNLDKAEVLANSAIFEMSNEENGYLINIKQDYYILISTILILKHEFNKADSVAQQVLDIRTGAIGSLAVESAESFEIFAQTALLRGDLERSEIQSLKSVNLRESKLGSNHISLCVSLDNLANIKLLKGDLDAAFSNAMRSLNIRKKSMDPKNPALASSFDLLAAIEVSKKNFVEAERHVKKAIEIRQGWYGSEHIKVDGCLNNLLNIYHFSGRDSQCEEILDRILRIREKFFGPHSSQVRETLERFEIILERIGKPEKLKIIKERLDAFEINAR